jgi:hypothetical protein
MTNPKLAALLRIADLVLDQRLAALRSATAKRDDIQRKLAALERTADWTDCNLQASARAEILYQTWADARRRDLNQNLARQMVAVVQAEDASRTAFGRHTALQAIKNRG